ncbi:hypothetical protein BU15DRAFT_80647 [Melanogaster broomeanus]|nr:hypothetical protein BU15DRAFT_80647 [Melanogaster broomeanus]
MLTFNGLSAWIEVDGKELEQYGVEEDLEKSENFSVVFRDNLPHREHALASYPNFDGTNIHGKVLRPPTGLRYGTDFEKSRTVVQMDNVVSATSVRPFVFSKLELTDEDEYVGKASKHLGQIQLSISRVDISQRMLAANAHVSGQGKVHERSKKAVSHCVSYGQEVKTEIKYAVSVRLLDAAPLATFVFKYRDYSLLQANGIVPKPPAAEKKPATYEEVLDLTIDDYVKQEPVSKEVKVLDDAIGAMQKQRATLLLKRSHPIASGSQPLAKRIKREGKFIPTGEVIDLT